MTEPADARAFEVDGERWIARSAGLGAGGTGVTARACIAAIHFSRADAPDTPLREALAAGDRLDLLYDEELVHLFRASREIVIDK